MRFVRKSRKAPAAISAPPACSPISPRETPVSLVALRPSERPTPATASGGTKRDGNGNAGDRVGDARPGLGKGSSATGSQGDAEVQEGWRCACEDFRPGNPKSENADAGEGNTDDNKRACDDRYCGEGDKALVRAGDPIGDAHNRRHEGGDDHGADDRGCAVGDKAQPSQ